MEVGGLKVRENTVEGGEIWEKGDGEERREGRCRMVGRIEDSNRKEVREGGKICTYSI